MVLEFNKVEVLFSIFLLVQEKNKLTLKINGFSTEI